MLVTCRLAGTENREAKGRCKESSRLVSQAISASLAHDGWVFDTFFRKNSARRLAFDIGTESEKYNCQRILKSR